MSLVGGKQLKAGPPRATKPKTADTGQKEDLRAKALLSHRKMQEQFSPKKNNDFDPRSAKIAKEELEGTIGCLAIECVEAMYDRSPTAKEAKVLCQVIREVKNSPAIELTEANDKMSAELSQVRDMVRTEIEKRFKIMKEKKEKKKEKRDKAREKHKDKEEKRGKKKVKKKKKTSKYRWSYEIYCKTDKGVRADNEDSFIIIEVTDILCLTLSNYYLNNTYGSFLS